MKSKPITFAPSMAVVFLLLITGAQPLTAQSNATGVVISVAFKSVNPLGSGPPMSGPEIAATEANPLFGSANVWNNLQFAFDLNTNPSFSNLVDSTGTATGVEFSITGTVGAVDLFPFFTLHDPIRTSTIFWNSWTNGGGAFGPGESTSIRWILTGLPPSTTFDMCVYGSFIDTDRGFDMTLQDTTMSIPTFNSADSPPPNCVLFTNIVSDGHGTVSGVGAGVGESLDFANEADWSGFQIVSVTHGQGRKLGFHRSKNH